MANAMLSPEGIDLEYKTAKSSLPKDFWPTYSAFANTIGGTVILGVSEPEKGQFQVVGVHNAIKIMADLQNTACNLGKVSTNLITDDDLTIEEMAGKTVVVVKVREAEYSQKPVYLNGNHDACYVRLGDGDHHPTNEQFKYMVANSNENVDDLLLDNYTVDDLNLNDINEFRDLMINNTHRESLKKLSVQQFLLEIGCFKIDRRNAKREEKMTAGCLLFFGKYNAIVQKFPGFQLDYFRKSSSYDERWINRISTGDMNYPEMNIYSFYNKTLEALTGGIQDKFIQDGNLTRGSYFSDMKIAVKEALVNSLMHAYYDSDEPISITEFDDYYEFMNPGDMRVTKEEFIHGSNPKSRNAIISLLLRRVGIAERAGSGGPAIFNAAAKNRLRVPDIEREADKTRIRIWKIDFIRSLGDFTESQKIVVTYAMEHNNQIIMSEMLQAINISNFKARKAVNELVESKTLARYGNGRATKYILETTEEAGILGFKMMLKHFEDSMKS